MAPVVPGKRFIITDRVLAGPLPQLFEGVTLQVPEVALVAYVTVILFDPCPAVMVKLVPLYVQLYVIPEVLVTE